MSGGTVKIVMREGGWDQKAGQTLDVDADRAKSLIENGHADKAKEAKKD